MKRFFLLAVLAISMAACSPFVLKSSGALNGSDLTKYTSFRMQKIEKDKLPEGVTDTDLIRLYRALGGELVKRGYTYVDGDGDADLTVYVGLSTKQSLETNVNTTGVGTGFAGGYGYGPGPGYGHGGYCYYGATPYVHGYFSNSTATTEVVVDGVVVVDLVDNRDNNHVFYTQISAKIDGEHLILKDNELLAKAAAKAFKKFPMPAKK